MIVCPLVSGSSGNATLVVGGGVSLLVDCGATGATIERALNSLGYNPRELTAVLVTHAHDDHVKGLGVISRRYNLPIYASVGAWEEIMKRDKIGTISAKNVRVFQSIKVNEPLCFGDLAARFFSTPHDAYDSVGYVFSDGKASFGLATDFGHVTPGIRSALHGCQVVLLESNYDEDMLWKGPYPYPLKTRIAGCYGHMSNPDAGDFAIELAQKGAQHIFLGHLSVHNNTQELAYHTVEEKLLAADVDPRRDCMVYMTRRYEPSRLLEF